MFNFEDFKKDIYEKIDIIEKKYNLEKVSLPDLADKSLMDKIVQTHGMSIQKKDRYLIGSDNICLIINEIFEDLPTTKQLISAIDFAHKLTKIEKGFPYLSLTYSRAFSISIFQDSIELTVLGSESFIRVSEKGLSWSKKFLDMIHHEELSDDTDYYTLNTDSRQTYYTDLKKNIPLCSIENIRYILNKTGVPDNKITSKLILAEQSESLTDYKKRLFKKFDINYYDLSEIALWSNDLKNATYRTTSGTLDIEFKKKSYGDLKPIINKIFEKEKAKNIDRIINLISFFHELNNINYTHEFSVSKHRSKNQSEYHFWLGNLFVIMILSDHDKPYYCHNKISNSIIYEDNLKNIEDFIQEGIIKKIELDLEMDRDKINNQMIKLYEMMKY